MSIDRPVRDARKIVTAGGFNTAVTLTTPAGVETAAQGVCSRHHLEFDTDGYPVNSTNAHILFSETALTALGLTVRNAADEVDLNAWLATYVDGTGVSRTYKIVQTRPSETLGLIICIVGRYGTN
jgi:hypothetical protein